MQIRTTNDYWSGLLVTGEATLAHGNKEPERRICSVIEVFLPNRGAHKAGGSNVV